MKKILISIVIVETLLLIVFSPNIYFEITNINRIEKWYEPLLDENMNGKDQISHLLNNGFQTKYVFQEDDGNITYIISPPFDQGIFTILNNRFLFSVVISKDKNGKIVSYGLYK